VTYQAKRRKLRNEADQDEYVAMFKAALNQVAEICSFCWVHDIDSKWHPTPDCPTLRSKEYGGRSFLSWCGLLEYSRDFHEKICYHCHIPQTNDRLHPTFQKGTRACEYRDAVTGVVFAIVRDESLRSDAQSNFNAVWNTEKDLMDWLAGPPAKGHKTNLTALFLWYADRPDVVVRQCNRSKRRLSQRRLLP
jgi:hypothetical protein